MGLCGGVYAAIVARRLRRQTAYEPEFEDWLFHVFLPFAGYVTARLSATDSDCLLGYWWMRFISPKWRDSRKR
jgi:hypothetical protein